ncbi:MAG: thioredoxin family protein [Campylobacterales bacterium]
MMARKLVMIALALPLMAATVIEKEWRQVKKEIAASGKVSVVELGVAWCSFCQQTKQAMKDLPAIYDKEVNFYYVDLERYEEAQEEYAVRATPTLLFFGKDGKLVEKKVGGMVEIGLKKKLEKMGVRP